jgi:hypothetical protein
MNIVVSTDHTRYFFGDYAKSMTTLIKQLIKGMDNRKADSDSFKMRTTYLDCPI